MAKHNQGYWSKKLARMTRRSLKLAAALFLSDQVGKYAIVAIYHGVQAVNPLLLLRDNAVNLEHKLVNSFA